LPNDFHTAWARRDMLHRRETLVGFGVKRTFKSCGPWPPM
jgi:hypothetical protein